MRRFLVLTAVALTLTGSASAATWSPPVTVSQPHTFVDTALKLGTTFDGSTVAAWTWQDSVGDDARGGEATSVRAPGGAFVPERVAPDGVVSVTGYARTQTLALASQGLPSRDPGTGVFRSRVNVAFESAATGGFGAVRTLATAPLYLQPAAAAGTSRAVVAWIEFRKLSGGGVRRIVRAADRADGRWGAPAVLSGTGRANALAVAMNARGDEVVVFARGTTLYARVRRVGHHWGSLQPLARAASSGSSTQWQIVAGVDDRGQVRVVWRRHQLGARTSLESAAMLVGRGTFTAAQTLTADGTTPPRLARSPQGWLVADVETTPDGPRPALHRTSGGSAFLPVEYAGPAAGGTRGADVVWSSVGGITVAWVVPLPGGDSDGIARAASLTNGAFGPVEDVTPAENVHEVRLAADPRAGQPVAVWSARPDGTGPGVPIASLRSLVRSSVRVP
jgi:hypothetical protein